MKRALMPVGLAAWLLSGCGTGSEDATSYATGQLPTAATVQQVTDAVPSAPQAERAAGEIIVGRALNPDGAIPENERTDRFAKGEEIHVAVPVRDFSPQSQVRVAWFGPQDDLLAEDAAEVTETDEYVSFSMAARDDFDPGEYRAEIWMDDQKITEQRFAVVTNGLDSGGG